MLQSIKWLRGKDHDIEAEVNALATANAALPSNSASKTEKSMNNQRDTSGDTGVEGNIQGVKACI